MSQNSLNINNVSILNVSTSAKSSSYDVCIIMDTEWRPQCYVVNFVVVFPTPNIITQKE